MVQVGRRAATSLQRLAAPYDIGASPERASVANDTAKQPSQSEDLSPGKATPALQARAVLACRRDVLERTILFWDILFERATNMPEHGCAGVRRVFEMYAWPPARGASS
jgi:hypothetical protein